MYILIVCALANTVSKWWYSRRLSGFVHNLIIADYGASELMNCSLNIKHFLAVSWIIPYDHVASPQRHSHPHNHPQYC